MSSKPGGRRFYTAISQAKLNVLNSPRTLDKLYNSYASQSGPEKHQGINEVHKSIYLAVFITGLLVASNNVFAQTFDEQFSTWPVDLKIQGTVMVSGGGKVPGEAAELFVRDAGGDEANIVILDFRNDASKTSADLEKAFERAKSFSAFKISQAATELSKATLGALKSCTGIWIRADSSFSNEQRLVILKHTEQFNSVLESKGTIFVEAGAATIAGKIFRTGFGDLDLTTDETNLVPGTVIFPNFKDESDRNELMSVLATDPKLVGIGIASDTVINLRQRQIRVFGDGQASFFLMANEHKPLRVQHIRQANSRRASPYDVLVDLTAWRRDAIDRTLPRFPKLKPETPNVKNGTLIIVGGGGMPQDLMSRMVELAGGENARMIYIPCTNQDSVSPDNRMLDIWKSMGVKSATVVHTKDRNLANSDETFLEPLKNATGIWFGGGRQWNFSDSYYGTEAHKLMKDVLLRGGVIGGSSAGASIQGRYLARANPLANFDIMADGYERGLGFLSGVAIDQHFTQRGRQKDMTQLVDRYPQLLGIGLDEATAIVVNGSQAEVVGRGDVYFYDRTIPVIPEKPDYIKVSSGNRFDLEKRKVLEAAKPEATESDENTVGGEALETNARIGGWQHWRGPLGNGTAPGATPPSTWDKEKNISWKIEIAGEGSSTPVVVGDKVFLTSAISTDRVMEAIPHKDSRSLTIPPRNYFQFTIQCFELETGKEIWSDVAVEAVPHEGKHKTHTYAAGSPVTDGKFVYVSFGSQGIFCYDLEGNKIWERDLGDMRTRRGWGEASTPAIYDNRLIVTWDHEDESKLFALDSSTGETVWEVVRDEPTTWAVPLVTRFNGSVQVIANGTNSVSSYDLATGELVWKTIGTTLNAIPSPVRFGDDVICMAGYQGNRAISIDLGSQGRVEPDRLNWRLSKNTPYVPSPALSGNRLYFTKGNSAIISCANAETGDLFFDANRIDGLANLYASPVVADGKVFVTSREGITAVLKDANEFELLGTNDLGEPVDASPVIVGDTILIRGNQHLFCIRKQH